MQTSRRSRASELSSSSFASFVDRCRPEDETSSCTTSSQASKMSCSSFAYYDYDEDISEYEYDDKGDSTCVNDQLHGSRLDCELFDEEDKSLGGANYYDSSPELFDSTLLTSVINDTVNSISVLFKIPTSAALIALRQHKWDEESLTESLIVDKNKCLQDAGVYHRCVNTNNDRVVDENEKEKSGMCAICYHDDLQGDQMHAMPCGHTFCVECWVRYISAKLEDGPSCVESTCPDPKCKELLTEEEVLKFSPELLSKYHSFQLRNYVSCKRNTRWCPGPDCKKVATLPHTEATDEKGLEIHCQACSSSFCLACGDEAHWPLACNDLKEWKETYDNFCTERSESWILSNTKPCPKCKVRIEKNGGCKHMTCKQCKHQFCWICNEDWYTHQQCNRFATTTSKATERELESNLHYFKRYHIHADAQKFAETQFNQIQSKLLNMGFNPGDNQSLATIENFEESIIKANKQLVDCRRTLKHLFIFAYYHLPAPMYEMESEEYSAKIPYKQFEFQKEMLEKFTEELSGLVEKPLSEIDILQLVNKTEAVKKFLRRFVSYVGNE